MRSRDLPPYNAEAICPKCGHDKVSTYYRKGCSDPRCDDHPESLGRTCLRCHFGWHEATIPNAPAAPDAAGGE